MEFTEPTINLHPIVYLNNLIKYYSKSLDNQFFPVKLYFIIFKYQDVFITLNFKDLVRFNQGCL
jgi:hypothetical protein